MKGSRRVIQLGASWSSGLPPMYLGITWAPRRIGEVGLVRETREVSTAMSVAELPMPSTSTLLVLEALVGSR